MTSLVAIPVALLLIGWPGGVPAIILCALVLGLAFAEYTTMCNGSGIPCRPWWGTAGILLLVLWSQGHSHFPQWLCEAALILAWMAIIVETGRPDRRPVAALGSTLLGIVWIGGLGSCFVRMRFWAPRDGFHAFGIESGAWAVIGLLVIVWCLDIFAYITGRLVGRTPLAPTISPKKTLEGSVGGFFAAAIAGMLVAPLMHQGLRDGIILGASIGVAGQIGDLFESAVKREIGVKDSGGALPGHGGWLDRIDSVLFASAVALWWISRMHA